MKLPLLDKREEQFIILQMEVEEIIILDLTMEELTQIIVVKGFLN